MSSYFDRMGSILYDKTGKEFLKLIFDQYWHYLGEVNELSKEKDIEKMSDLMSQFWAIKDKFDKGTISPEYALSDLHGFAHELGSAQIELDDGRYAGDNPWLYY
jgi:hypothetical protein